MNKKLYFVFLFIILVLAQVVIFNNILLFGDINPYLYIAFIIYFPLSENKFNVLIVSFFLGLSIDFFSDTGGIHAFASVLIAYLKLFFLRIIFNKTSFDYQLFSLSEEPFGKVLSYVAILTFIHHLMLLSFANFSFQNFGGVILDTIYSSIFTLILFFLGSYIFRKKQ